MTLIAGFRSLDQPTLVGDFRLSMLGGRLPAGVRKKVLIVAENFALAWCDSLDAANRVVSILQQQLPADGVTLEIVRRVLADPATVEGLVLHVQLIGWIVD